MKFALASRMNCFICMLLKKDGNGSQPRSLGCSSEIQPFDFDTSRRIDRHALNKCDPNTTSLCSRDVRPGRAVKGDERGRKGLGPPPRNFTCLAADTVLHGGAACAPAIRPSLAKEINWKNTLSSVRSMVDWALGSTAITSI